MGQFNWKQRKAIEKNYTDKIDKLFPNEVKASSGIYAFWREEHGFKFAYVGQAVDVLNRVLQHLIEHKQHIDNSLDKRGLYDSETNKGGWRIKCWYCDKEKLDANEQMYIKKFADIGYQLYNTTAGGQGEGKVLLTENKGGKGYRQGVDYGYQKCLTEIREYFEKYFDITYNHDKCFTKKGELKAIPEKKMLELKEKIYGNKTD